MFKRAARRIQTEEEVMSVLGLDKEFKAVDVRKKKTLDKAMRFLRHCLLS